jgi:myosin heavy subunit
MDIDDAVKESAIAAVIARYDGYIKLLEAEKMEAADKALEKKMEAQKRQMEELGKTEIELINVRRERAKEEARASGASSELIEKSIAEIDAYYDSLVNEEKAKQLKKQEEEQAKVLKNKQAEQERLDKQQQQQADEYLKKLEELGKEELELIEIRRKRAVSEAEASGASDELIKKNIESINAYYDGLANEEKAKQAKKIEEERQKQLKQTEEEADKAAKKQADLADSYIEKTEEVGKGEIELLEIRRKRAIEDAKAEGGTKDAIDNSIKSINAYYDALVNEENAKQAAKIEEDRQKQLKKTQEETDRAAKKAEEERQRQIKKAEEDAARIAEKQEQTADSYIQKAEEVGKKELELIEIRRAREIAAARAAGGEQDAIDKSVAAINAYYDALTDEEKAKQKKKIDDDELKRLEKLDAERDKAAEKQLTTDQKQKDSATSYQQKLEEIGKTELELIEIERKRAIAAALASGASARVINENIDAINEYYDALKETTAEDAAIAKTKKMASDIKGIWDNLSGSLASLFSAIYDDKLDALESQLKAELEAAGLQEKSASELAEAELTEARKQSAEEISLIQQRLDAATEAGDAQSAMLIQQQLDEANAKAAEVEREKQAAIDKAKIEEDYEKRRAKIQFDAAMVSWKIQMAQAVADAAMLALNGFLTKPFIPAGLIAGGVATAQGALQISAVKMAKPKLATGGIVLPQAGGRDVTLAENGYAEMALNAGPSGQEMMGLFAQQIVDKMQGGNAKQSLTINVQVDRKTLSMLVVDDINNGRVRLER